jgi:hypothetical protein
MRKRMGVEMVGTGAQPIDVGDDEATYQHVELCLEQDLILEILFACSARFAVLFADSISAQPPHHALTPPSPYRGRLQPVLLLSLALALALALFMVHHSITVAVGRR